MSGCRKVMILILILMIVGPGIQAMTIKIGSVAPDRSPWHRGMKELAREWARITDGFVKLKIYPGSIAGNEEDMIRKMRMGILGGAVLTNQGMIHINRDVYVTTIPMMFDSEDELDHVMSKLRSTLESQIEGQGFKVVLWTMAGWINFFSKHPVIHPDDLKRHKISFSTGRPEMEQAWKKAGFRMIPNELKDMLMGLQSGMVNAFYLPPLLAASGQYFPFAPNMCEVKVAPLLGGIVLTKRVCNRIPKKYHEPMLRYTQEMSSDFYKETIELEKEAIETMKENGLKIHPVPPEVKKAWKATAAKGMDELIGKAFSREIYEELVKHLNDYRSRHGKKGDS